MEDGDCTSWKITVRGHVAFCLIDESLYLCYQMKQHSTEKGRFDLCRCYMARRLAEKGQAFHATLNCGPISIFSV